VLIGSALQIFNLPVRNAKNLKFVIIIILDLITRLRKTKHMKSYAKVRLINNATEPLNLTTLLFATRHLTTNVQTMLILKAISKLDPSAKTTTIATQLNLSKETVTTK